MKIFIMVCVLYAQQLAAQTSVYDVRINSIDSETISLANFKGQKLLIASLSPDNLKAGRLKFFDSLQQAFPKITIVVIPAEDFGGRENDKILSTIKNTPSKHIKVGAFSKVKKTAEKEQNPLLRWLTHSSDNSHFDSDATTDEMVYVVSESGILYARLEKGVSLKVIDEILRQPDIEENFRNIQGATK